MKKFVELLNDKIVPAIVNFTQWRYMKALMDAFMGMAALSIAGSIFTLVKSLPFGEGYTSFLVNSGLMQLLDFPIKITSNLMALYLVFCIGYFVTKSYKQNPLAGGLLSLGSFLMLTPFEVSTMVGETMTVVSDVIPLANLGAQGIFLAIIVGMVSSSIYVFFLKKNFKIKMPPSVPENVSNMFESMIPTGAVFLIFMLIRSGVSMTEYGTAQTLIFSLLQKPLTYVGGGLSGMIIFTFMCSFLWLFGVHGSIVTVVGMYPIYSAMLVSNMSSFAAGTPAPNPEWAMMPWTALGGTGATFGLVILMLFRAKSKQLKLLGKIAFPTSLFNINEPVLFGIPIVMNPFLAIPFILVPLMNLLLTYFVMVVLPIIPVVTGATINAFMPVGFIHSLSNAHWSGFVWTIMIVILDIVCWYPFFKKLDSQKVAEEKALEAQQANS